MMKMPSARKAPHRTFGDIFGRVGRADFASWKTLRVSPLWGWLAFAALCIAVTGLMTVSISGIPTHIAPGTIAQRDIRADRNYEIVDKEATDKFKTEAASGVLSVYDYDTELGKTIIERMTGEGEETISDAVKSQILSAMASPIIADKRPLALEKGRGIVVRRPGGEEDIFQSISSIRSLEDVKRAVKRGKAPAAAEFIQPNFTPNIQETEGRRKRAVEGVKNVVMKIEAGEMIIRGGARYEPRHITLIEGIRREKEKASVPLEVVGTFLLVALVILSTYYFAERYIRKFAPAKGDLYFMGAVLIIILVILRLSLAMASALYNTMTLDITRTAFSYAIPVAGAAMLVRFILNSETALVFSIVLSIFAGVFAPNNLNYTAYCLISSVAAAAAIAYADKRSAIIKAGIYTAVVNVFAVIGIHLVNAGSIVEPLTVANFIWYIVFAIVGGLSCSVFVTIVTPIAESIFGYTTDIKLLELANLNHPLLRELVIRAPGTYHHSHLVGILAESAAAAIGTNPLLVRVAAYYHDIGKIKKPLYFTENMREGESRHDKLSPHMSALIVASHVKDGIDLAAEYKIPRRIIDMIPQHHGTKMISFFYDKALKLSDPERDKLGEKDFRYPGPKPQTREAGILMLADAAEASVRSLKEKGPARIQETVEGVINNSFAEGQLNECDMTLRDLNDIAKEFIKILIGIYHQRVEYPKEALANNSV